MRVSPWRVMRNFCTSRDGFCKDGWLEEEEFTRGSRGVVADMDEGLVSAGWAPADGCWLLSQGGQGCVDVMAEQFARQEGSHGGERGGGATKRRDWATVMYGSGL